MSPPSIEKAYSGKRTLITGGLGFIGSNLARRLADLGAAVTVMDSLPEGIGGDAFNLSGYESRLRIESTDIRDSNGSAVLVRNADVIFNLAGQVGHLRGQQDPQSDLDINVRGQLAFLETCRRHAHDVKIVFTGTRQVYGAPRYLPVDENHPLNPPDINAVNKLAGERYHLLYHRLYGLRSAVLRMSNVYGPRMRVRDGMKTFLGLWIRQLLDGEAVTVYGDGGPLRDMLYVEDAVDALLLAGSHPGSEGQVYNAGGAEPIRLLDLAKLMIDIYGGGEYRLIPYPADRKPLDIGSYFSDLTRIRSELGWRPITPLRQGLTATLDFYRRFRGQYW